MLIWWIIPLSIILASLYLYWNTDVSGIIFFLTFTFLFYWFYQPYKKHRNKEGEGV